MMANDGMRVVTIMTRKGGAGKTTLTKALMSAALQQGKRCLALDADPQQALHRWIYKFARDHPLVTYNQLVAATDLQKWTDDAYESGDVDLIFVDSQGAAGAWADDLAAFSDVLVVPMMLGWTDFNITTDTINWYTKLHDRVDRPDLLPPLKVIVSNATGKPNLTEREFEERAARDFPLMRHYFMARRQHKDADNHGFLHDIAEEKRTSKNWNERSHAKHFEEAAREASDILDEVLGGI